MERNIATRGLIPYSPGVRHRSIVRTPLVAAVLGMTLLFGAGEASAQDALTQGTDLLRQGRYEEALQILLPAYASDASSELAYTVARCYDSLHDDPMSIRFYKSALALRGLDRRSAAHAKRRMRALKKRLKTRPKKATLSVSGNAPGARVVLDGQHIGSTPLSGLLIRPGRHTLRVTHDSFEPWTRQFVVEPYGRVHLTADMNDKPTDVLFHTDPAGATAAVTGGPSCVTPCLVPLRKGRYTVTLKRPGYQPLTHEFDKPAGQLKEVRLSLRRNGGPAPAATGFIGLTVTPAGAALAVDGAPHGTAPFSTPIRLTPGIHRLEVTLSGHDPWRARVEVAQGQTTQVAVQLKRLQGVAPVPVPKPRITPRVNPTPKPLPPPRKFTPPGDDGPDRETMRTAGWALLGSGSGLIGVGIALTTVVLVNQRRFNTAVRFAIEGEEYVSGITQPGAAALEKQTQDLHLASLVLYGVGAAVLTTGVILLAVAPDEEPEPLTPKFGFTPLVGPGFAGAQAEIRF